MSRTMFMIWLVASLAWSAFIIHGAVAHWPHIPLDMGGADTATDAAYQAAQLRHVAKALFLGIGGAVAAFIMLRFAGRALGR